MWRKKKDPLLELLGYDSEQDLITADDELRKTVRAILDGDLETIVEASELKSIKKEDVAKLSGIIKGNATKYVQSFFAKASFQITEVEEDADETRAAIHLKGQTVSAKELTTRGLKVLADNEATLQLLSGELDLRKVGKAMELIEDIIAKLEPAPVSGVVHMEKRDGRWKMTDSNELSFIMVRASMKELEKVVLAQFSKNKKTM